MKYRHLVLIGTLMILGCSPKTYLVVGHQVIRGDSMNVVMRIRPAFSNVCKPIIYPINTIIRPTKFKVVH